jgi:hypothetical protein
LSYQVLFILNFIVCFLLMKGISWLATPKTRRGSLVRFYSTPYISPRTLKHRRSLRSFSHYNHLIFWSFLLGSSLILAKKFLLPFNYWKILIFSPTIYFLTEALGALGQVLFSWSQEVTQPMHYRPLWSHSLSEFWGRRWNLWVQDWLKDLNRLLYRLSSPKRMIITFAVSGLFHEIMINFPYWLLHGISYFGTMMLYFLIQALALWVDKHVLRKQHSHLRRTFLWFMVITPSPLFINVPLLTFLGLK